MPAGKSGQSRRGRVPDYCMSVYYRYSPIGVMCLVAAKVVEMEDPEKTFQQLVFYFITVLAGLGVHGLITLPLIYFITTRKNPFSFIYGVLEPMVTALATSSR